MPKLSDVFMNLLGNTLDAAKSVTPFGIASDIQQKKDIQNAENARQNLSTLSNLNQNYNAMPPNSATPGQGTYVPPGTFTPPPDSRLVGIAPGTSYAPLQKTATTPIVTPGKTPGSANVNYSSRLLGRGEVMDNSVNTIPSYVANVGHQMGFQKDLFDKYDSDMHTAQTALAGVAGRLPKGIGQSLVDSITSGVGIPAEFTQSPEYQANQALIQKFSNQYLEAKKNRDAVLSGGLPNSAGSGGGGGVNTSQIPPPPSAAAKPPLGQVSAYNKISKAWVFVPAALATNTAIYAPLPANQGTAPQ